MSQMFNVRNKLGMVTAFVVLILCVIAAVEYISWSSGRAALNHSILSQLTSIRSTRSYQVRTYFEELHGQVADISNDPTVAKAMTEFATAFAALQAADIPAELDDALSRYYKDEFVPRLEANTREQTADGAYLPSDVVTRYLQYHYIAANPAPLGAKDRLESAEDGSSYSRVHAQYHSYLKDLLDSYGYYDIFLIEPESGNIVYSVYKETDFATSLTDGPYQDSNLAEVVDRVRANPRISSIQYVDFAHYAPSYSAPAAFFAGPVYDGAEYVGIIAFQLPVDQINRVMTGDGKWQADGLGETGETYLVGADMFMRSNSRFAIEDSAGYQAALLASGESAEVVELIAKLSNSILLQQVDTPAVQQAIAGIEGTDIIEDYRGIQVLSSYAPVEIEGLTWVILAEIDLDEAYAPIYSLRRNIVIWSGVFFVLLVGAAFLLMRQSLIVDAE